MSCIAIPSISSPGAASGSRRPLHAPSEPPASTFLRNPLPFGEPLRGRRSLGCVLYSPSTVTPQQNESVFHKRLCIAPLPRRCLRQSPSPFTHLASLRRAPFCAIHYLLRNLCEDVGPWAVSFTALVPLRRSRTKVCSTKGYALRHSITIYCKLVLPLYSFIPG